jgi:hypothetical protein
LAEPTAAVVTRIGFGAASLPAVGIAMLGVLIGVSAPVVRLISNSATS